VVARLRDEAVGCGGSSASARRRKKSSGSGPPRLLAPLVAAVMTADGDAIVSGLLLLADVAGVLASWRAQGFDLIERIGLEDWASLRLRW
jgi:hypothetical protein